jgi:ABC-2 type transport system ATP-binding protein
VPFSLSVNNLSKKYKSFNALTSISFNLNAGEIAILAGPNGSGKTTLLSCISGLIKPTDGEVQVEGFDLYRDEEEAHRRLMFVPDVPRFYLELTAWEHLKFVAMANHAEQDFDQRAESLLKKYGLWKSKDLFPHNFSRGMRLKLGLALALIRPFKVLLLDEPTSALDSESVDTLCEELKQLRSQGAAVLLSTHDADVSRQLGDRVFQISLGRLEVN